MPESEVQRLLNSEEAITMDGFQRHSIVVDKMRRSIPAWQERVRDPSLTVLLVQEICAIFLAAPLAAKGLPVARALADALVLAVLVVVVVLSPRLDSIILILRDWRRSPRALYSIGNCRQLSQRYSTAAAIFSPIRR
jgi:hypothetical protein